MEIEDASNAMEEASTSTSSEDDSDAATAALEARVTELESEAQAQAQTPGVSSYNVLLELLKAYRVLGELQKLREIREQFSAAYPLSHDLWVEWIEDEKKLAQTQAEKVQVLELIRRAAKDYFSVDIYIHLISYMQEIGHEELQTEMDQVLDIAGYDLSGSHALWELCLKLSKSESKRNEWLSRVAKIPLLSFDYSSCGNEGKQELELREKVLNVRKPLEDKLKQFPDAARVPGNGQNDKELTKVWYEYVQLEMSKKPGYCERRLRTVFERAVSCSCLSGGLWERFVEFMDSSGKGKGEDKSRIGVYHRATRNCSWNVKLWKSYLLALERCGEEIGQVFFKALQLPFESPQAYYQLLMAACEQRRRAFERSKCTKENVLEMYDYAKEFLRKQHPSYLTAQLGLFVSRMKVEHYLFHHDVKGQWLSYLEGEPAAQPYTKALSFFYSLRDWEAYRKVARQAISALQSDKFQLENICSAWVSMEKEFGGLEDLYFANTRVSRALRELRRRSHSSKRDEEKEKSKASKEQGSLKKRSREAPRDDHAKRRKISKEANTAEAPQRRIKKGKRPAVFVINLKYGLTNDTLAEFFSACGKVATATVLKGRNKGRGKVEFEERESIEKALAMSGKPLQGLPVKVLPFKGDKEARHKLSQERKKQHVTEKVVADEDRRSTVLLSCLEVDACKSLHNAITQKKEVEGFPFGHKLQGIGPVKAAFIAQNLTSLVVTFEKEDTAKQALELSKDEELCKGVGAMKPRRIKISQYAEESNHRQPGRKREKNQRNTEKKMMKMKKSEKDKQGDENRQQAKPSGQAIVTPCKSNEDFRKMLLRQ